jgi:hypothetical protein
LASAWGRSTQDVRFALRSCSWAELNFLRLQLVTLTVEGPTEDEMVLAVERIRRMLDRRWLLYHFGDFEPGEQRCSVQTVAPKSTYL